MKYKHIFGPVPSRRLGISLGMDVVPFKTCGLDCVYCECGKTTLLTNERKEYIPADKIIAELDHFLAQNPRLDYITFSGGGEPTLNSGVGRIVAHIKKNYPQYKICLLTNALLLGDEGLAAEIRDIDLIVPSLDATNEEEFEKINRPVEGFKFADLAEAIVKFRKSSPCRMWLEVFIVPGINDSDESLARFAGIVRRIAPDKIQLNTLDRPGTEDWVRPASEEVMLKFKAELEKICPVEVVKKFRSGEEFQKTKDAKNSSDMELARRISELICRRPCTIEDISAALEIPPLKASKIILKLKDAGGVVEEKQDRGIFYRLESVEK